MVLGGSSNTKYIKAPFKGSTSLLLTTLVTFNELCEETGSLAGAISVLDSAKLHC